MAVLEQPSPVFATQPGRCGSPSGVGVVRSPERGGASAPSGLTRYSIITAGSLDEAAEKAKAAPVVANGGAVEVYEAIEIEM